MGYSRTKLQSKEKVSLITLNAKIKNYEKEYQCHLFFEDDSQSEWPLFWVLNQLIKKLLYVDCLVTPDQIPKIIMFYWEKVATTITDYSCNFKAFDKGIICEKLPVNSRSGSKRKIKYFYNGHRL